MADIIVSDKASEHLAKQINKLKEYDVFLLRLKPDGCSGYQFDLKPMAMSQACTYKKIHPYLYIEVKNIQEFSGLHIDIEKQQAIFGYKLVYHFPKAKAYCGCGKSFQIERENNNTVNGTIDE